MKNDKEEKIIRKHNKEENKKYLQLKEDLLELATDYYIRNPLITEKDILNEKVYMAIFNLLIDNLVMNWLDSKKYNNKIWGKIAKQLITQYDNDRDLDDIHLNYILFNY